MARKPKRNPAALVRALCERIIEGETVTQVCADLGLARGELWRWTEADESLRGEYARARELQAHAVAEQALAAAHGMDDYAHAVERVLEVEEARLDAMTPAQRSAHQSFVNSLRNSAVTRDKLRTDTLKWAASKMAPREYGERIQQDVTGSVSVEHLLLARAQRATGGRDD